MYGYNSSGRSYSRPYAPPPVTHRDDYFSSYSSPYNFNNSIYQSSGPSYQRLAAATNNNNPSLYQPSYQQPPSQGFSTPYPGFTEPSLGSSFNFSSTSSLSALSGVSYRPSSAPLYASQPPSYSSQSNYTASYQPISRHENLISGSSSSSGSMELPPRLQPFPGANSYRSLAPPPPPSSASATSLSAAEASAASFANTITTTETRRHPQHTNDFIASIASVMSSSSSSATPAAPSLQDMPFSPPRIAQAFYQRPNGEIYQRPLEIVSSFESLKIEPPEYRAAPTPAPLSTTSTTTTAVPLSAPSASVTRLAGIGVILSRTKDGSVHVEDVVAGAAADRSGMLQVGDRILEIERRPVSVIESLSGAISGPEGTTVNLVINRPGQIGTRTVSITRGFLSSSLGTTTTATTTTTTTSSSSFITNNSSSSISSGGIAVSRGLKFPASYAVTNQRLASTVITPGRVVRRFDPLLGKWVNVDDEAAAAVAARQLPEGRSSPMKRKGPDSPDNDDDDEDVRIELERALGGGPNGIHHSASNASSSFSPTALENAMKENNVDSRGSVVNSVELAQLDEYKKNAIADTLKSDQINLAAPRPKKLERDLEMMLRSGNEIETPSDPEKIMWETAKAKIAEDEAAEMNLVKDPLLNKAMTQQNTAGHVNVDMEEMKRIDAFRQAALSSMEGTDIELKDPSGRLVNRAAEKNNSEYAEVDLQQQFEADKYRAAAMQQLREEDIALKPPTKKKAAAATTTTTTNISRASALHVLITNESNKELIVSYQGETHSYKVDAKSNGRAIPSPATVPFIILVKEAQGNTEAKYELNPPAAITDVFLTLNWNQKKHTITLQPLKSPRGEVLPKNIEANNIQKIKATSV